MAMENANKTDMLPEIRAALIKMAEPEYQSFTAGLLPGVENLLGVRLPKLRKYAGQIRRTYGLAYLDETLNNYTEDHDGTEYLEEIFLQGMVIGSLKVRSESTTRKSANTVSLTQIQDYIRKYIPKINNWSTCDSFCTGLKVTKEYPEQMWEFIQDYLVSERCYDVRFGLVMIINYFIRDTWFDELFDIFGKIGETWQLREDNYYVEMALAWAISICYVYEPDKTYSYLKKMRTNNTVLDDFTYNKALQKITESNQISQEEKAKIRLMKRTKKA